jgi:hypothetical protein
MSVLVRSPQALTACWAQSVLEAAGAQATVTGVRRESEDVGTTTRVRLTVDHDGPDDLPRRWFVKLPSGSWRARAITALPQLPQTEVRFYRDVADRVPVSRPQALAAVRELGRGTTLVLGDVTESGARPGANGEALSAAQAATMIDLLVRLHASHWEDPVLRGDLAWLAGPVRKLEDRLGTALAVPLMRRGLRRAGEAVPASLHGPALRYARRRKQAMRVLAEGPQTLVHHDCHPGNLYWRGEEAGLLDWQLVRIGEGVGDVAYLLATCLEPEVRRKSEEELLARYARGLAEAGHTLDVSRLRTRYRAHMTYAFEAMVLTLAIGGLMTDAVALEMVRRVAAAVEDQDAFGAIVRA